MADADTKQTRARMPAVLVLALTVLVIFAGARSACTEKKSTAESEVATPSATFARADDWLDRARRMARDRYDLVDPVLVHLVMGGIDARNGVDVSSSSDPGGMIATFAARASPIARSRTLRKP